VLSLGTIGSRKLGPSIRAPWSRSKYLQACVALNQSCAAHHFVHTSHSRVSRVVLREGARNHRCVQRAAWADPLVTKTVFFKSKRRRRRRAEAYLSVLVSCCWQVHLSHCHGFSSSVCTQAVPGTPLRVSDSAARHEAIEAAVARRSGFGSSVRLRPAPPTAAHLWQ
jgi:hypothetical protein